MLSNEIKFWSDMMLASHPGWSVVIANDWKGKSPASSKHKVNIYAYDIATGWSGACMTSPADLADAQKMLEASVKKCQAIRTAAQSELIRLAEAQAGPSAEVTRRGLVLAMYYIAQTQTLKTVRSQYGRVDGHWLCLLYRFKSGLSTMRPAYMSQVASEAMFSHDQVAQWASEASEVDAKTEESGLNRLLRKGEELIIQPGVNTNV